jgi:hypothetical protein
MLKELPSVVRLRRLDAGAAHLPHNLPTAESPSAAEQSRWAAFRRLVEAYRHPIALAVVVFCVFLPTMAQPRLFMDDYPFLYGNTRAETITFFTSIGRPLTAGYLILCRDLIHHHNSVALCYLVGIAGAILLAIASFSWLRRNTVEPFEAALLSLLIVLLPSVQVYVSWITAASATYAAALATCALLVFDSRRGVIVKCCGRG